MSDSFINRVVVLTLLLASCVGYGATESRLVYSQGLYSTSAGGKVAAEVVENKYYRMKIVPGMGGRILEFIDKQSGKNLVFERGYGGMVDDHRGRIWQEYGFKWLRQDDSEGIIELWLDEEVSYRKTIRMLADKPVLEVEYHCENNGQDLNRMLFRNVLRPGGGVFSEDELYCSARTNGIVNGANLPYRDLASDPWAALVSRRDKTALAVTFVSGQLERFYSWRKGVAAVAPTFEFTMTPLKPGHKTSFKYYIILSHGLDGVDYAHRDFLAQIKGGSIGGTLDVELKLLSSWGILEGVTVAAELLDESRRSIRKLETRTVDLPDIDMATTLSYSAALPPVESHYIALFTLEHLSLETPVVIEKMLAIDPGKRLPLSYERPIRMRGMGLQEKIDGWEEEKDYVVSASREDRRRGYLVFEESGAAAGKHVDTIELDLAQYEPEGFPLHFYSTGYKGSVAIGVDVPEHFKLETFIPEIVPQDFWTGEVRNGLKLIPGNSFEIETGEDRTLFFRLTAEAPDPGTYKATMTFTPEGGVETSVSLKLNVYPVRFAEQPIMVFDANNSVNMLATRPGKTRRTPEWDQERSDNFFHDMRTHGLRGHNMSGVSSPFSLQWYNRVRLRDSGRPLLDAIKESPELFQDRIDLPELDFSEWDWFCDQFLRAGMTHFRVQLGRCGDEFLLRHNGLTKLIYGGEPTSDSLRHNIIREWYDGAAVRYFKDRGIVRIYAVIDDEIPSEKYTWWIQHASSSLRMGFEPGATMSAELIADDQLSAMVSPLMRYWIIGTMHKPTMDLRFLDTTFKPGDRVITYHSEANHWQKYDQMRGRCGLESAYYNLAACWIQTYDRFYSQVQTVVYPGEKGPISSAAWEGARDGLDDANYLLLARAMIASLPAEEREVESEKLEQIVGMREDSAIGFHERPSNVGPITPMGRQQGKSFRLYRTVDFRQAKRLLLDRVVELSARVPVQRAAANLGLHAIVADGQSLLQIPAGTRFAEHAVELLEKGVANQGLDFSEPVPREIDAADPYPVFFMGTIDELEEKIPVLRAHPDLADIDENYPAVGGYALRFLRRPVSTAKPGAETEESMVVIVGDKSGADRAVENIHRIFVQPEGHYSHWLLMHRK